MIVLQQSKGQIVTPKQTEITFTHSKSQMATNVQIGQGTIGRISRRKSKKDRQLNNLFLFVIVHVYICVLFIQVYPFQFYLCMYTCRLGLHVYILVLPCTFVNVCSICTSTSLL
jgi:hypothetical protein